MTLAAAGASYGAGISPWSIASADFNRDGARDLVIANYSSGNGTTVLLGTGTFGGADTYTTSQAPAAIATADFNRDGKADVAIAALNGTTFGNNVLDILLGDGSDGLGAKTSYAASGAAAVAVGDFNRDGIADAIATNQSGSNFDPFKGNGDGTFNAGTTYATGSEPWGMASGDFNRDGKPDIAVGAANSNALDVLINNGNGTFKSAVVYATGSSPYDVVSTDWNRDGKVDVAISYASTNNVGVLLNQSQ